MSHPQEVRRRRVDRPFRLSASLGTIDHEGHDAKKSTPERRSHAIAQGPRRHVKGHDRLVNIVHPTGDTPPPSSPRQARPSICPTCGLTADNGITVQSELTATATYCDTAGHLWAVTWMAVA